MENDGWLLSISKCLNLLWRRTGVFIQAIVGSHETPVLSVFQILL